MKISTVLSVLVLALASLTASANEQCGEEFTGLTASEKQWLDYVETSSPNSPETTKQRRYLIKQGETEKIGDRTIIQYFYRNLNLLDVKANSLTDSDAITIRSDIPIKEWSSINSSEFDPTLSITTLPNDTKGLSTIKLRINKPFKPAAMKRYMRRLTLVVDNSRDGITEQHFIELNLNAL